MQAVFEKAITTLYWTAPHLGQAVVDAWPDNTGKIDGKVVTLSPMPTDGPYGVQRFYVVDEEEG